MNYKQIKVIGVALIVTILTCSKPVFAKTYYVDVKGSDSNKGTKELPWQTLNKALTSVASEQGNTIKLGNGNFDLTGVVLIPSGINIIGSGTNNTIIQGEMKLVRVKNTSIKNLSLNGKSYAYKVGSYIRDSENLNISNLAVNGYAIQAFDIQRVKNSKFYNMRIADSSFNKRIAGGGGQQSYTITIGNLTNVDLYNIIIDTTARGGAGIGSANDAWPKKTPWSGQPGVFRNLKLYNLDIKVDKWNAWGNGWTPQMALEFWHHNCFNCQIFNSTFNSTVSLFSFPTDKPTQIQVYNNLWYGPNNPFYACEVASDNIELYQNYIRGGSYPIAQFGYNYKNLNVHHNIFERTGTPTLVAHFLGKISNFRFTQNTVYFNNLNNNLFYFQKGEEANQKISNNIFYNTSSSGKNSLGAAVGVSNNLFVNLKPSGKQAMNFDPKLALSGEKPFPYYKPQSGSRAVNLGAILANQKMWNVGYDDQRTEKKP